MRRLGLAAALALFSGQLFAQDQRQLAHILQLFQLTQAASARADYDAAEKSAEEAITFAEGTLSAIPALAAQAHANLSDIYLLANRPADAEAAARKAVAAGARQQDVPAWMQGRFRIALVKALAKQGEFAEAEPLLAQALADNDAGPAPDIPQRVEGWVAAALFYCDQGRFDEAAGYMRRCLNLYIRMFGTDDVNTLALMEQCVQILNATGRKPETETLSRQLVDAYDRAKSPDPIAHARVLENFAGFYLLQNRVDDGLPLLKRALEVRERALGPKHPAVYDTLFALAAVYRGQGNRTELDRLRERLADAPKSSTAATQGERSVGEAGRLVMELGDLDLEAALPRLKQLAAEEELAYGADSPSLAPTLLMIALFRTMLGPPEETEKLFARIDALTGKNPEFFQTERCALDSLRAQYAWARGEHDEAVGLLENALKRRLRPALSGASGTMFDRGQSLAPLAVDGKLLLSWQFERRDVDGMLRAAELLRSRIMLEQIRARNLDVYAGVPADEVQQFRSRMGEAYYRLSTAQANLNRIVGEKRSQSDRDEAQSELETATAAYVAGYRELLNAGAATKLNWNEDAPTAVGDVQRWAERTSGPVLHYSVFEDAVYLIAFAPDAKPRMYQLELRPETARTLGVPSGLPYADTGEGLETREGRNKFNALLEKLRKDNPQLQPPKVAVANPLTGRRLQKALENEDLTGVLQLLSSKATGADLPKKLAALTQTLLPDDVLNELKSKKHQNLTIITDGALALLPFEALVIDSTAPTYLIEVVPPIAYSSSMALLSNLAERDERPSGTKRAPLLTVADPDYHGVGASAGTSLPEAARFYFPGGTPSPIPYSGQESRWLEDVFKSNGFVVGELRGANALERWVHEACDNRRIVHLACHGFVDRRYGNLFGALALAAGENAATDPKDDGALTLAEISRLDLRGTELAILSACQTNVGPLQFGEGTSGISRSFLVAGARRVVASNWLVDDEAAAGQVSYYGSIIAEAMKQGHQVEYAAALREAKLWTKSQEKWSHPYYWAVFTHVGPN